MKYTKQTVISEQSINADGIDTDAWEEAIAEEYCLKEIPLSALEIDGWYGHTITIGNWLAFRADVYVDAKPLIDIEGLITITNLMLRYRDDLPVNPIVIGTDNSVVDGLHRIAAMASLGRQAILAYVPSEKSH